MKQQLLTVILFLGALSLSAQEWTESSGIKANFVREAYVTQDQSAIITSGIGNSWVSEDEGASWTLMSNPDGDPLISEYFAETDGLLHNILISEGAGSVTVFSSSDNGLNWTQTGEEVLFDPWAFFSESVHAFDDQLYISMDDTLIIVGADLQDPTYVYPGFPGFFPSQGFSKMVEHQGTLFALGPQFAGVRISEDGGLTWETPEYNILSGYVFHIATANGKLYLSDGDTMYEFDDSAQEFVELGSHDQAFPIHDFIVEGDRIITRSESADLHISEDLGQTWSAIPSFIGYGLPETTISYQNIGLLEQVGDSYVVGGIFGTMRASVTDLEFESALEGHTGILGPNDIAVIGDEQLCITDENLKFRNASPEGSWTYLGASVLGQEGSNITAFRASLHRYDETIYSSQGHLLRTEDVGSTWDTLFHAGIPLSPEAYMDMGISDDYIFLGTTLGPHRSGDDGETWENMSSESNRTEALCYKAGELFYAEEVLGASQFFYSTDQGESFVDLTGNLEGKVKDIKVAGGTVFVVSSTSTWSAYNNIWMMSGRDGVWSQVDQFISETTDGAYFDMFECDDYLFASTPNFMIYTADGGSTWVDITYNLNTLAPFIDVLPREWANDTLYCTSSGSIYKLPLVKEPNSIDEMSEDESLHLFPNPSQGILYLQSDRQLENYRLYDMHGRTVQQGSINGLLNTLDISALQPGAYHLQVQGDDGLSTRVLVRE